MFPGKTIEACFGAAAALRLALVLAVLLLLPAAKPGHGASLEAVDDFGPNPGQLDMFVYRPDDLDVPAALVVALHGCLQKASDFDDETGLIALAERFGFVLLFPEQRPENNEKRCFNWFQEDDNRKGGGESASIRNMIDHAMDGNDIDPSRVFVLGLSAGGSMTAVLMANYPGLFQGGAIVAGTPYACNGPTFWTWGLWSWLDLAFGDEAAASFACGLFFYAPTERTPEAWGDLVRALHDETPSRWPKVSLWQGDADEVVDPANQSELLKQWTNVHGIDRTADETEDEGNIRHEVYRDADGLARVETYEIRDLDHAMAIDPGTGPEQCGIVAPYIEDADICSTLRVLEFWGIASQTSGRALPRDGD